MTALPDPIAPMAPDPFVPVVSTPVNDITVRDETTLCERLAVTVMLLRGVDAKARQISESPLWAFVRPTNAQFNPPPVTLDTVVFAPER